MTQAQLKERSPLTLRTLVVNADGRPLPTWPLSVLSAQDAVTDAWLEKATIVEEWPGAYFRSPTVTIAVPKVLMLRRYAQIDGEPKFCRRSVLLRDRYQCQYCGDWFPDQELTYDHVVPRSKGGRTVWDNIVMACVACNAAKKNKDANHSGRKAKGDWRPLKPPRVPTAAELMRAGLAFLPNDVREDFGSWLYWNAELVET